MVFSKSFPKPGEKFAWEEMYLTEEEELEQERKSKEERIRDRRAVLILFLVVFAITMAFYFWPKISGIKSGAEWKIEIPGWKGYSEVDM